MTDELKNFFEVALALRNECKSSGDSVADAKIDALIEVCAEVIRRGKIPSQFYIEKDLPIHTELVEKLFEKLPIEIKHTYEGTKDGAVKLYWINFCTF